MRMPRSLQGRLGLSIGLLLTLLWLGAAVVTALVVRGELDVVVPQPWFDEVVAAIPDATSFVVEGHHHETLIRTAEPTVAELRRWLDR